MGNLIEIANYSRFRCFEWRQNNTIILQNIFWHFPFIKIALLYCFCISYGSRGTIFSSRNGAKAQHIGSFESKLLLYDMLFPLHPPCAMNLYRQSLQGRSCIVISEKVLKSSLLSYETLLISFSSISKITSLLYLSDGQNLTLLPASTTTLPNWYEHG